MFVSLVLFHYETVASVLAFGVLECCSLRFHQKIAKYVMNLSSSVLQRSLKCSKFSLVKC